MPKRVDAVVIGSGPGGLACASMLAKRGKACLILEANEALGGGLHSWEDKGVPFDTGFHYLGEVHCGKCPLRCLLDYLAGGRLSYSAMADCEVSPGCYDELNIGADGHRICFAPGEGGWRDEMKAHFPREAKAVDGFRRACLAHVGAPPAHVPLSPPPAYPASAARPCAPP